MLEHSFLWDFTIKEGHKREETMQLGNLHFKHMDEALKDKVVQRTAAIFERLKHDYFITGTFERSKTGEFLGTIHAESDHGNFHAHAQNPNLGFMITDLKKKVRAQIEHHKSRALAARHQDLHVSKQPISWQTPSLQIVPTDAEREAMSSAKPVPRVLIIDDDIEAIVPMEMIFREMGCETSFAIERQEAINKLRTSPCDIIVLDWMLDSTTGGELIRGLSQSGEAFAVEHGYKPVVITYSGLDDKHIEFPENEWFEHIKHWTKPIRYDEISSDAKSLIKAMGF